MNAFLRILVILVALPCGPPVLAQNQKTRSDISISLVTLSVDGTERTGNFAAGETVTAEFLLQNDGTKPVSLLRIALLTPDSVSLVNPVEDGIDNNFSRDNDEPAEGFHRFEREGAVWRMLGEGLRLEPGDAIRRRVVFQTSNRLIPGTSGYISVSAGTTLSDGEKARPRKTKAIFPLTFLAPTASLSVPDSEVISVLKPPQLKAAITLPTGVFPNATLAIALSPALKAVLPVDISSVSSVKCNESPKSSYKDNILIISLGRCVVDADANDDERTYIFALDTELTSADPTSSVEAVREWRRLTANLTVMNGGIALAHSDWEKSINGPLPFIQQLSPSDLRLKPGDPLEVSYVIENRGDRPVVSPRIVLNDPETFDCKTFEVTSNGASLTTPCDGPVLIAKRIESGDRIDVMLRATLRQDALIGADTSLTITMEDQSLGKSLFHAMPLLLDNFDNPTIESANDNTPQDADITASIGGVVSLKASGVFPRGRYEGGVRIIARLVDALTGAPIGPAPLQIKSAVIEVADLDITDTLADTDANIQTDGLWSAFQIPVDLRDASKFSGVQRRWNGSFELLLPDHPDLAQARVVDIAVETLAYETRVSSSFDAVQVLVAEPDVVIKLFTLDDDRTIQPGETVTLVGLACNYGDSGAYDVRMKIGLPNSFSQTETTVQPFIIPLDVVRGGYLAEAVADQRSAIAQDVNFEQNEALASLPSDTPLQQETCFGVEIKGTVEPDWSGASDFTEMSISLPPVLSNSNDSARVYPAQTTPALRLQVPAVNFGPPAILSVNADGETEHNLTLKIPDDFGTSTLSLETSSSSRLPWTVSERLVDGTLVPWVDGVSIPERQSVSLVLRANTARNLPLGWTDTTSVSASVTAEDGRKFTARVRMVTTGGSSSTAEISTEKRMAIDRNCDGALSDETAQDALFESGKDILPGECVVVRIGFSNSGKGQVEKIVIRDAVAARTKLVEDSVNVRIAPEPLDELVVPDLPASVLEWQFHGLFRPGAVGEVEYTLRLTPTP